MPLPHRRSKSIDEKAVERLRRLANSILRRCSLEELAGSDPGVRVLNASTYGDIYVLEQLWERSRLAEVLGKLAEARERVPARPCPLCAGGPPDVGTGLEAPVP